jgi:DNA repair photolyase
MSERMFSFLSRNHKKTGDTWNPLGGKCLHGCRYCYVETLKKMFPGVKEKYNGVARTNAKWLNEIKQFTNKDFVFVCDMTDLFGYWVPTEIIQQIFIAISNSPAKFLLLTKNPERYRQLISIGVSIPQNCVLGCTVESDVDHISGGMMERARLMVMMELRLMGYPTMLSIEPIMAFTNSFLKMVLDAKPKFVAVGYDNYNNGLVEPCLAETCAFITLVEAAGITVYRKTLRESIQYCEKEGLKK